MAMTDNRRESTLPEGIPDRLYGRQRGHKLRPRQERLLEVTLPRLRFLAEQAADPHAAFAKAVSEFWIEVGFGGGEHAEALAAAHPHVGLVASEVFENGLCSLLSRLVPEGQEGSAPLPPNLRLWPEDARHLVTALPASSVDRLYLMFPDPWPKARHAKRRFVHPAMMPEVARILRPGGEWRVATDDPTYQAWVAECFAASPLFTLVSQDAARPEGWPATRYERKAYEAGRHPMWWVFRRV